MCGELMLGVGVGDGVAVGWEFEGYYYLGTCLGKQDRVGNKDIRGR